MVPRVSPSAGAFCPAARGGVSDELEAPGGSTHLGPPASQGVQDSQPYGLLHLSPMSSPTHWRSLEELANSADFQAHLEAEFPEQASDWADPVSRRELLKLAGASLALAGLSVC